MDPLRLIVGGAFILLGLTVGIIAESFFAFFINIGIGVLILIFSAEEDKLEQRKDLKPKKSKR